MKRWQAAFAVAVLVQCWALYVPRPPSVETGLPLDKAVHVILFALVTWLGVRAGLPGRWVVGLMLIQAVGSEVVQHFWLSQRGGDLGDLVADLIGIAAGWWLSRDRPRRPEPAGRS